MKRIIKALVFVAIGGLTFDTIIVAGLDDEAFEAHVEDMRQRRAKLRGQTPTPRQRNF